nr:immunoglobulin heavy chain junction region [Mus musculus]
CAREGIYYGNPGLFAYW